MRKVALSTCAATTVLLAGCSSGPTATGGAEPNNSVTAVDPNSLAPTGIVGLGPHGEQPATADSVKLTEDEATRAKAAKFKVGVVMQTMDIDWSRLQVKGITETLQKYGAEVIGVTDARFKVETQIADIQTMIQRRPQAIISIPVDDTATAEAYKKVSAAGIKLVFIHQPPRGLSYPTDYASVISPDNQGNGQIAAKLLAEYIPKDGTAGIIDFGVDFFTTNQRSLRVKQWLKENRPDIKIKTASFLDAADASKVSANFLTANPDVKGIFAIWDAPAMGVVSAQQQQGKSIPITTIDLGTEVALQMAKGGLIKGLGAQQPYDQGVAEALAVLKTLLGQQVPPWIALPAVPVTPRNVLTAYREVFHADPPAEITAACQASKACG